MRYHSHQNDNNALIDITGVQDFTEYLSTTNKVHYIYTSIMATIAHSIHKQSLTDECLK